MSPRFFAAVDFVLQHETEFAPKHAGDYRFAVAEHDGDDPGGTTKFGIDQRSHPEVDIEALTLDGARQIYFVSYWGPSHAEALPNGVGEFCFDAAVNCGLAHAAVWLQTALQDQGAYHGAIDGRIGPLSLAAAFACPPLTTLGRMAEIRNNYYARLAAVRPRMKKYLAGWLNRDRDLLAFASPLTAKPSAPVVLPPAPAPAVATAPPVAAAA